MSQLAEAMIVNGVVLVTVLGGDLGSARKIGWLRILRLLIAAAVIIRCSSPGRSPTDWPGGGNRGAAAGVLGGLAAVAHMGVYRSPQTGWPVSRAAAPYAILWIAIIGARAAFSYGSVHWFSAARWSAGRWRTKSPLRPSPTG